MDIKEEYLQSDSIERNIYARLSKEYHIENEKIWWLLKLPYGITDAGRQLEIVFEDWLLSHEGLQ